ncbi:MAG: hypothetical protein AAF078_00860 [Planctomycetota bacterium]
MTTRHVAGFVLIPLALLGAASAVNALALWSLLGNFVIPWFCTAVAIATLIVGVTCLLSQSPPSAIPARVAVFVVIAVLLILGIGFVIDLIAYAQPGDWLASLGEWVGFAVILTGAFWLTRVRVPSTDHPA